MRLEIGADVRKTRSGFAARASILGLCGAGKNEAQAVDDLRRGVLTWAYCLSRSNRLDAAAKERGILVNETGEGIDVDLKVALAETRRSMGP